MIISPIIRIEIIINYSIVMQVVSWREQMAEATHDVTLHLHLNERASAPKRLDFSKQDRT